MRSRMKGMKGMSEENVYQNQESARYQEGSNGAGSGSGSDSGSGKMRKRNTMSNYEMGKQSILLALLDSATDFDEYYLYFMLPLCFNENVGGCKNLNYVFSSLIFAKTLTAYINKPTCGIIIDYLSSKVYLHYSILFSGFANLASAIALMYFGLFANLGGLIVLFLIHDFSSSLLETNAWKIIKLRTQLIYGKENVEEQEKVISRIGVNNAIVSDTYEALVLIFTFLIGKYGDSFTYATTFLAANIILSDALIFYIGLSYDEYSMYKENVCQPLSIFELRALNDDSLEEQGDIHEKKGLFQKMKGGIISLWEKIKYIWGVQIAFHALSHSLILYFFTEIAEYPLSFALSEDDEESGSGDPTLKNFCKGKLLNLVLLAIIDNVVYAVGSVIYSIFFVKMLPCTWFRTAFPIIGSGILGVVFSLWYVHDVPKVLSYILTSCLIVVPYYCEKYNFYFASACIDEKYFGFVFGLLAIAKNFLETLTSLIFYGEEEDLKGVFSLLLLVCAGLVGSSIIYSAYLYRIYKKYSQEKAGRLLGNETSQDSSIN